MPFFIAQLSSWVGAIVLVFLLSLLVMGCSGESRKCIQSGPFGSCLTYEGSK